MGRFGHEFLGMWFLHCYTAGLTLVEFDFRVVGDGRSAVARYANNSNYRNDSLIRKESMSSTRPPTNIHSTRYKMTDRTISVCVSSAIVDEIKRIIKASEVIKWAMPLYTIVCLHLNLSMTREDDSKWPQKNKDGRQELEIRLGSDHISFEVGTICNVISRTPLTNDRQPR